MSADDPALVARVDPHGVHRVLADFPAQCRAARALRATPPLAIARPRLVIVAGMGGSAAGGDLLAACAADTLDVPILVHRGYGLPAVAGPGSLVIASSYSGETVETLSAAETALARRAPLAAITAGGMLAVLAAARAVPRVAPPPGLMPRMALGHLFFPALTLLAACGLAVATEAEIDEALSVVQAQAADLAPGRPAEANEAKRLALAIGERWPAVYGGQTTGSVAYRWKTDLEENAKTFAIAGALPEMNHNEIEAWRAPAAKELHVVLLRDRGETPEIARRFSVLREMIAPAAAGISETWSRGESRLARLLSLTYLGQWVSYYLALQRETDPWTIPMLEELKRRMRPDAGANSAPRS